MENTHQVRDGTKVGRVLLLQPVDALKIELHHELKVAVNPPHALIPTMPHSAALAVNADRPDCCCCSSTLHDYSVLFHGFKGFS